MKVAFVIRKNCERCARIVSRIIDILPHDWEIVYDRESAKFLGTRPTDLDRIEADAIIAVGGDGTVLRSLQLAKGPVLGINMGSLGFLSEVEIGEVESSIYRLIRGEYKIERTMKLSVKINGVETLECSNEVVIHSRKIAKIRKFRVYVGGDFFDSTSADGMIIATPIGSTSYSFSAGGPILYPSLQAMVLTYIAPFRTKIRPMVVPSDQEINVKLFGKDQDSLIILDGQEEIPVNENDDITVSVSRNYTNFITFRNSFYERIREKLIRNVVN
ncbi:NAD(+) kinase [Thermoplasmatales archaeon AK]|nr:NAD(+) kinase [Thermoplasmatales archaeon AK]